LRGREGWRKQNPYHRRSPAPCLTPTCAGGAHSKSKRGPEHLAFAGVGAPALYADHGELAQFSGAVRRARGGGGGRECTGNLLAVPQMRIATMARPLSPLKRCARDRALAGQRPHVSRRLRPTLRKRTSLSTICSP
jgi:hypothetical protein